MKQIEKILGEQVESILKQTNLNGKIKIKYDFSNRFERVLAQVRYNFSSMSTYELRVGNKFFTLQDRIKYRILQHEIAHIYDRYYNKRRSKHDKVFKDLCEGLYGDRTIGQATIKGW